MVGFWLSSTEETRKYTVPSVNIHKNLYYSLDTMKAYIGIWTNILDVVWKAKYM